MKLYLAIVVWVGLGVSSVYPVVLGLWLLLNLWVWCCHRIGSCCVERPCCELSHQHRPGTGPCTHTSIVYFPEKYSGGTLYMKPCTAAEATTSYIHQDPFYGPARVEYYQTYRTPETLIRKSSKAYAQCPCKEGNYQRDMRWGHDWEWIDAKCIHRIMEFIVYDALILTFYCAVELTFVFTQLDEWSTMVFACFIAAFDVAAIIFFLVRFIYFAGCCYS